MAKRVFARFRHFASFSNRREPIATRVLRGFNFGLADSLEKKALRLSERRRKLKGHTRDSNRKRFLIVPAIFLEKLLLLSPQRWSTDRIVSRWRQCRLNREMIARATMNERCVSVKRAALVAGPAKRKVVNPELRKRRSGGRTIDRILVMSHPLSALFSLYSCDNARGN